MVVAPEGQKQHLCRRNVIYILLFLLLDVFIQSMIASDGSLTVNEKSHNSPSRSSPLLQQPQRQVYSCQWSPEEQESCMKLLKQRILRDKASPTIPRRFFFLGDSTIAHFYRFMKSEIPTHDYWQLTGPALANAVCPGRKSNHSLSCPLFSPRRCGLTRRFNLTEPTTGRVSPNYTAVIGPSPNGKVNCQECFGCRSKIRFCRGECPSTEPSTLSYTGSFFGIEFARDVELQSEEYGSTTQENMVGLIQAQYRAEGSMFNAVYGGPAVCITTAGVHDTSIPNFTIPPFLDNAEWYLALLLARTDTTPPVCRHVVWLHNTAPLRDDENDPNLSQYRQNKVLLKQINDAVESRIQQNEVLLSKVTVIDVYKASVGLPHHKPGDNIHLHMPWYKEIGGFFWHLMRNITNSSS